MFKARFRVLPIAMVAIVFASILASPAQAAATKYPLTVGCEYYTKSKKGMQREMAKISFINKSSSLIIDIAKQDANWLLPTLEKMTIGDRLMTLQEMKESHEAAGLEDFELFIDERTSIKYRSNNAIKVGAIRLCAWCSLACCQ